MFWRGVIGYLPANIVQGLVGFGSLWVFTRLLSAESYGLYAVAFAVVSLVHTLLFTWTEAAMARFQVAEGDRGSEADHAATLYRLAAWLSGGLMIVGVIAVLALREHPEMALAIGVGLAAAAPRCVMRLVQERARADGHVRTFVLLDVGASLVGLAAGALLAEAGLGGAAPLAGAGVASLLCSLLTWRSERRRRVGGRFDAQRARRYAAYGLPVSVSLMLSIGLFSVDRMMIASLLSPADAGAYHAGYSVASRTLDVLFIWLGAASGPALVAALERGGAEGLRRAALPQAELMLLIALPATVGIMLVSMPLAQVMVGPELRVAAAQVTPGIAVAALISGFSTYYVQTSFTLFKRTQMLLITMSVPLAANVALNVVLIPRLGLMGAVWATAVSFALGALTAWALSGRTGRLPLPWATAVRCALACAAMAVAVRALPASGGLFELLLKAGVGGAVYVGCVLALDAGRCRSLAMSAVRRFGPAPALRPAE
jgi:O-antigen/teichoic acid export membrane protein